MKAKTLNEIYDGVPEKEIRLFLGSNLECFSLDNAKRMRDSVQESIAELKQKLEVLEKEVAVHTLIQSKGWSCYDISDYVKPNKDNYGVFIGTREEFSKVSDMLDP